MQTSAKTGDNVEEAFVTLARQILQAGQGRTGAAGSKSVRLQVRWYFARYGGSYLSSGDSHKAGFTVSVVLSNQCTVVGRSREEVRVY